MAQVYTLPTQRYAGAFLIELDPTVDWTGTDAIIASDGSAWLDYTRLPVTGGTENRVISREISDGADTPVRTLRATHHMNTENGSLSSGAVDSPFNNLSGAYSPAIFGGRRIIVQDPLGAVDSLDPADWKPRFWGHIDDHPANSAGDISIFARDASARLMIPYTGDPFWVGEEGQLIALDEAIQTVLDGTTGTGVWALKSPGGDLEWAIPAFQLGNVSDILQFIRDMAQQRGAVVRWWPDSGTGRFQLTLFVLQEEKEEPDYTYEEKQTVDIPAHGSDVASYRNDFRLKYLDAVTGQVETIHRAATESEIASFGLRPLVITEASTSQITTAEEAGVMLDSVEGALRVPATVGSRVIPWNPDIEVNTLIRFAADGRVTQEAVDLYVVSWSERVTATERSTTVQLRGAPVGQIGAWLKSIRLADQNTTIVSRYGFREWYEVPTGDAAIRRWYYEAGSHVSEVWAAARLYPAQLAEGAEPPEDDIKLWVEPTGELSGYVELSRPRADQISILRVEPRVWVGNNLSVHDDGVELVRQVVWYPEPAMANGFIDAVEADGVVGIAVNAEPTATALPIAWEVREGTKTGTLLASGTWTTQAEAQAGETSASEAGLGNRSVPSVGKRTWFAKFTDVVGNVEWHSDTVSNPTVGGIGSDAQFSTGYDPIRYVDDLLTPGVRDGQRVILRSTKVAYAWDADGGAWVETELDADGPFFAPAFVANSVTTEIMAAIEVEVGKYIRSSDYDPGVAGWSIDGDGDAEFNSVLIRDEVEKRAYLTHALFRAANFPVGTANHWTAGVNRTVMSQTGETELFHASPNIPVGAEIHTFKFHGRRGDSSNTVTAVLHRVSNDGLTSVTLETINVTTSDAAGDEYTATLASPEVADEDHFYAVAVTMEYVAGVGTAAPSFEYARIDYTSYNYRQTL